MTTREYGSAHTWHCKDVNLVPCFDLSSSTVSSTISLSFLLFFPTSWHASDTSELLLRSLLLFFVLLSMHHSTHSGVTPNHFHSECIRTCLLPLKSHIKIKNCRERLSHLFLQQSFNSIQRLYIIGMHVPYSNIFLIVTSSVWVYHLGSYWWQNKPLCTFGIRLGADSGMFTLALVGGQGQVVW